MKTIITQRLTSHIPTPEFLKIDREAELRERIRILEVLLARYRDETPLGHQPHMIASEVDEVLKRTRPHD